MKSQQEASDGIRVRSAKDDPVGVARLLRLAVCVELRRDAANPRLLRIGGVGEGERIEAAALVVARVIADTESPASGDHPRNVHPT